MSAWLLALLMAAEIQVTMRHLPDTGQTRHFAAGDDADYSAFPPAFSTLEDGIILDEVTGLQWQQAGGGEMKWDGARAYCTELRAGGYEDWRVPTNRELFSIINHNNPNPALDRAYLEAAGAEYWWSAEPRADDPSRIWSVNAGGGTGPHPQEETVSAGGEKRFHVRCVRHTAVTTLEAACQANVDSTVSDLRTGLMWQQNESEPMTWSDALAYVKTLDSGGFRDWRLPNIKELQSLHDEQRVRPAIDTQYFPSAASAPYWSSTTLINREGDRAWTLDFTLGIVSYNDKTNRLRVRAVRTVTVEQP